MHLIKKSVYGTFSKEVSRQQDTDSMQNKLMSDGSVHCNLTQIIFRSSQQIYCIFFSLLYWRNCKYLSYNNDQHLGASMTGMPWNCTYLHIWKWKICTVGIPFLRCYFFSLVLLSMPDNSHWILFGFIFVVVRPRRYRTQYIHGNTLYVYSFKTFNSQ